MDAGLPIVVVDDDERAATRAARALERGGYEPKVQTGGDVSVEDLADAACLVTEATVDGRDGIGFAETLRGDRPGIAIVVYTDDRSESVASRALAADVDEYVRKGAGETALLEAVARAVEHRGDVVADEAKRLERERDLQRYRTIVETVGDMIYALDESGRFTLANHAFAGYIGRSPDELVGADVAEVIPDRGYETGEQLIKTLLSTSETNRGRYEFRIERPDGTDRHLENDVALLYDEDGNFSGTVGVVRDVTERREQERRLERQNERLEEFASIVGHDLRNPLNVIAGRTEMAQATGDVSHLDAVERCVDRMDELLTDLLTLAREGKRVDEISQVDLEGVAREAWQNLRTVDGELSIEPALGTVEADRARLRQCFENLFRNAFEHTDSGTVCVTVEPTADGFAVCDDGPGIDTGDADRLFDRGFTTRHEGTGIGLSIVERIVEAHGWTIAVDPSYDDGARFVVDTTSPHDP